MKIREKITMSRGEIIDRLIEDDIDTLRQGNDIGIYYFYFREGFCGYEKYDNQELKQEYLERINDYPDIRVTGKRKRRKR